MILALSLPVPGQDVAQAPAPDPLGRAAELLSEGRAEEASTLIEASPLLRTWHDLAKFGVFRWVGGLLG